MLDGVTTGLNGAFAQASAPRKAAAVVGAGDNSDRANRSAPGGTQATEKGQAENTPGGNGPAGNGANVSKEKGQQDPASSEARELQQLKARDREVRQHEQAHMAAGGQYVKGGPSFDYQKGPDGRRYAVGGEVQIDTSAVRGDPEATLRKMEVVMRAALAPAEPSGQDRAVAAQAAQAAAQARADIQQQHNQGEDGGGARGAAAGAYRQGETQPPGLGELIDITA